MLAEVLADVRLFLARATVIELVIAFALASAGVAFLGAVASGFVIAPIEQRASGTGYGVSLLTFVLAGRVFYAEAVVESAIVLLGVLVLGGLYVRVHDGVLFEDEDDVKECPHCLSEIRSAAAVCSFCTRDVPPATAEA